MNTSINIFLKPVLYKKRLRTFTDGARMQQEQQSKVTHLKPTFEIFSLQNK